MRHSLPSVFWGLPPVSGPWFWGTSVFQVEWGRTDSWPGLGVLCPRWSSDRPRCWGRRSWEHLLCPPSRSLCGIRYSWSYLMLLVAEGEAFHVTKNPVFIVHTTNVTVWDMLCPFLEISVPPNPFFLSWVSLLSSLGGPRHWPGPSTLPLSVSPLPVILETPWKAHTV